MNQNPVSGLIMLLVLVLSSFSAIDLKAQEQVTGTVVGADGLPLPGVSVLLKGTNQGAATDFDGVYSISMAQGSNTLVFSYVGYKSQEVEIGNRTVINITLQEDVASLDEVVVIGFQKFERDKILGSTTNITSESIAQAVPVDVLQGVQGKASGVQILSNNGPGEGFDIRIRGIGSFNGATGPLYVVDGQQTFDIDNLNPNDIESFEILKDGASTAPYGAQGANGVVVITTKSGKSGETKFEVTQVTGLNTLVGKVPVANARQRILMERLLDDRGTNISRLDSLSLGFRGSTDIQEALTRPGFRSQTNVTLSGGSDKARYNWSTGYLNQEGVVLNSDFKRLSSRVKLDLSPSSKFSAGTVLNFSYEETNGITPGAVLSNALNRIAYIPLYEPDGSFLPTPTSFNGSGNPLQQLFLRENNIRRYRFSIFNYAEFDILPVLTIRSTLGLNSNITKGENFVPSSLAVGGSSAASFATAGEDYNFNYNIQQDNVLNYNQKFGKHNLSAFAAMQLQVGRTENLGLDTRLSNDLIETLNNANLDFLVPSNGTQNFETGQFSLAAGFNYDFDNKYLLGATIRRDGSSRFGPFEQFGYFPSASVGWRVSKEGFMKKVKSINNLLFKASFGIVGNDRIGNFEFLNSFEPDGFYNGTVGFVPVRLGNEIIKWEETESTNLGFELSMFKRRLNVSADVWKRDTKDLLVSTQLPEESGFSAVRENRGVVRNKGIDFSIDGTLLKNQDFSLKAGFNIGLLDNEVIELDTPIITGVSVIEEGEPIGNFTGYKQHGIFRYDESNAYDPVSGERLIPNFDANGVFLNSYNTQAGELYNGTIRQLVHGASGNILGGGDYIWDDKNNDGVINDEDTQILGNGIATVYGGFTTDVKYKNFTLGVLFDYSFGNEIYRRYDHDRNSFRANTITASPERLEGAWTNPGDITIYPIIASAANRPQNRFDFAGNTANSLYIEDGSFIKWRYIRFGYSVAKDVLDSFKIGLNGLDLNLQVNNILTWTNYSGYNPEFGTRGNVLQPSVDTLRYPNDRELLLSLKVQF